MTCDSALAAHIESQVCGSLEECETVPSSQMSSGTRASVPFPLSNASSVQRRGYARSGTADENSPPQKAALTGRPPRDLGGAWRSSTRTDTERCSTDARINLFMSAASCRDLISAFTLTLWPW